MRNIATAHQRPTPKSKSVIGGPTLSELRKSVHRLFNKAKCIGNCEEYKHHITTNNKGIKPAKQNSFRRFCENVS